MVKHFQLFHLFGLSLLYAMVPEWLMLSWHQTSFGSKTGYEWDWYNISLTRTFVISILEQFDFNARCSVISYEMARNPRSGDVALSTNQGARYEPSTRRLVDLADHGDTYYVDRIKVKCPGDVSTRELSGMIFRIK